MSEGLSVSTPECQHDQERKLFIDALLHLFPQREKSLELVFAVLHAIWASLTLIDLSAVTPEGTK